MLAVTFVVSCLSVCGFYVYVLVQLRREEKRGDAHKKHLPEHLYEMEAETRQADAEKPPDPDFLSSGTADRPVPGRRQPCVKRQCFASVSHWEAW
jgi:hypothetical protein